MSISNIVLSHSNLSSCYFPGDVTIYGNTYVSGALNLDGELNISEMTSTTINSDVIGPASSTSVLLAQASRPVNSLVLSSNSLTIDNTYFGSVKYITLVVPSNSASTQSIELSGLDAPAGAMVSIVVAPTSAPSQTLNVLSDGSIIASIASSNFGKMYQFITFGNDNFSKVVYG